MLLLAGPSQAFFTSLLVVFTALVGLLLYWMLGRPRPLSAAERCCTLAILGSGGHTMEMLAMLRRLDGDRYRPLHFLAAETDASSEKKVRARKDVRPDAWHYIPRSREVGQSFLSSVPSTLRAAASGTLVLLRVRPQLLLCNGPGTCLPVAVVARVLTLLRILDVRLFFVESFCRTESLSLTGKVFYRLGLADRFVVHWPELKERYDGVEYLGTLF